ncbi:MAG TPA: trypsin-like peptidase domain-containing protein [Pyrinomonadaceae bacterium]|nr:trypsin-like peptidase domain-containing protein [Pyrinomonadaceae bacterium]
MSKKAIYYLSARQIIFLALASAFITAGTFIALSNFGSIWQVRDMANVALAEYAASAISDPSVVSDEQNSIEVYKTLAPGVAFIKTSARVANYYGEEFERERGNGSGSVIDNQGHILTNSHVVEGASSLSVSFGGDKVYPAKVIGRDPDTDLAVIKIEPPREGLTVISLGDSDRLNVGQKVLAIGNPFGLDRTLTTGVISGLQRPIRGTNQHPIEGAIQTDASINPGNSGGPLLDKYGKMIGINAQIYSRSGTSSGVGFAIPVNIAKRVVPQLIQFGEVRRPKLGASLLSVEQLSGQVQLPVASGLLVRSALAGGAAANSGIRGLSQDAGGEVVLGDIITAVDGEKMKDLDDLYRYLDKKQIGDTVQAEVFRNGRTMTIPIKLSSLPQQSVDRQTRRY